MNTKTLQINGNKYQVKFGFKANRILAEKWEFTRVGQVADKLYQCFKAFDEGGEDSEPEIAQLVIIGQLVLSGVEALQPDADIDEDDVVQALLMDIEQLPAIVQLYIDNIPKPKAVEPKNVKRGKKKQ